MPTKFICLANSFKEGGRCIAGIVVDSDHQPVLLNGRPKWIRPVCNTEHGQIPEAIAEPFKLLDIIEMKITGYKPEHCQTENVLFNEHSIQTVGTFNINQLARLCENSKYIFGTRYSSVPVEIIHELNHSLMLINTREFEVVEKGYEDRPDKPHQRLLFSYNGYEYDFSITDPVFLRKYQRDPDFMEDWEELALCLSVGIKFAKTNRHYKLVAGIICLD